MNQKISFSKVGVYVDTSNIYLCGGRKMRYDILRQFAARDNSEIQRLNAYVSYDAERASEDSTYKLGFFRFHSVLRSLGYKVIIKEVKWYEDETGKRVGKANADLDLAVDMLLQSESLQKVLLVSADGDFVKVVNAVQNKGCRVEVVALDNVASSLRNEADVFISGFLIPDLVPIGEGSPSAKWGEVGSTVRGMCYYHSNGYGFMRFLKEIAADIWITDTSRPDSPYGTAFFHDSNLPPKVNPKDLPSYSHIFEFTLAESKSKQGTFEAADISLKSTLP